MAFFDQTPQGRRRSPRGLGGTPASGGAFGAARTARSPFAAAASPGGGARLIPGGFLLSPSGGSDYTAQRSRRRGVKQADAGGANIFANAGQQAGGYGLQTLGSHAGASGAGVSGGGGGGSSGGGGGAAAAKKKGAFFAPKDGGQHGDAFPKIGGGAGQGGDWVTVFGFGAESEERVLQQFRSYGDIEAQELHRNSAWLKFAAKRGSNFALGQAPHMVLGDTIVGVVKGKVGPGGGGGSGSGGGGAAGGGGGAFAAAALPTDQQRQAKRQRVDPDDIPKDLTTPFQQFRDFIFGQ